MIRTIPDQQKLTYPKKIVAISLIFSISLFLIASCASIPRLLTPKIERNITEENAGLYLKKARESLIKIIAYCQENKELFQAAGKNEIKSVAEKNELRMIWSRFLDSIVIAQRIEETFDVYQNIEDINEKHAVFLVHYEAFLLSYRYALTFFNLIDKNDAIDTVLNESSDFLGLPENTLAAMRYYYLHVEIASRFASYQVVHQFYERKTGYQLSANAKKDQDYIWETGKGKGLAMTFENGIRILQSWSKKMIFPAQKSVSELMGDMKVKRIHSNLITEDQIHGVQHKFKPGDIFFERREWYLSNIGLPGFWTHMAFYVGTSGERKNFFNDDKKTAAWVRQKGVASGKLESLLEMSYPLAYKNSQELQEDNHLPRLLEAVSEGVLFASLEHSAGADSVGVLRPKLDKVEVARAIYLAFSYYGKPYDFDFDFVTDNTVVCSELVYKAYEPEPPFKGIEFPIESILGKKVSLPNSTVRQFDQFYGTRNQQLNFVLFLDGLEKGNKALVSDLESFRNSWNRPKWHVFFQKNE